MTKTKQVHTPGPWRIGDAGTTIFGPKTDAISPITIVHMPTNKGYSYANARLIAAIAKAEGVK